MLERLRGRSAKLWFVALYALAVAAIGFGHRLQVPAPTAPEAAVVAALPGGIVPALCADRDAPVASHDHAHGCDACRVADAPGLDVLPAEPAIPTGTRLVEGLPTASGVPASGVRRAFARGPPASSPTS